MITDGGETIADDIVSRELLHDVAESCQDGELTRLTEMVRKHYLNYLEKQLYENLKNSNYNIKKNGAYKDYEEVCKNSIKKTAELLEDKAVRACMIAKFYQRAMIKIIAIVRRTTEENKLITHLEKCIQTKEQLKTTASSKETQTEVEHLKQNFDNTERFKYNENITANASADFTDRNIMSLDDKIEMFRKQTEKCIDVVSTYAMNNSPKLSERQQKKCRENISSRSYCKPSGEQCTRPKRDVCFSPTTSSIAGAATPTSPISKQPENKNSSVDCREANMTEIENSNDSVAAELARLFSEEKTELDEIFGIDPNEEPDDPQICKILKEIEEAKVARTERNSMKAVGPTTQSKEEKIKPESSIRKVHEKCSDLTMTIDLSKSLWPCELFMQRRKLSESLACLIEEDLRWHDVIKWRFSELFGEDSDDEFTPCSPSIELNEVLIGSCIRRISPWVVKYLMKPMKDGLIANRFLFKKLAKNIARSIIMENQYPDETIIKESVENFFCLHQAVMSLEDLDVNIPNISSYF